MAVDIRCTCVLTGVGVQIRCQLLAGHEGRHVAVGSTLQSAREAWRWTDNLDLRCNPYQAEFAAGLPWAPGMPTPEHRSV